MGSTSRGSSNRSGNDDESNNGEDAKLATRKRKRPGPGYNARQKRQSRGTTPALPHAAGRTKCSAKSVAQADPNESEDDPPLFLWGKSKNGRDEEDALSDQADYKGWGHIGEIDHLDTNQS